MVRVRAHELVRFNGTSFDTRDKVLETLANRIGHGAVTVEVDQNDHFLNLLSGFERLEDRGQYWRWRLQAGDVCPFLYATWDIIVNGWEGQTDPRYYSAVDIIRGICEYYNVIVS